MMEHLSSTSSDQGGINTFVFLDLETSSLEQIEHPKIMEICLIAVHRKALLSSFGASAREDSQHNDASHGIPRVLDKLTLCFYPNKPVSEKSFELTGLDNYSLDQSSKKMLDADAVTLVKLFLARQEGPVCLVAHNGDKFDFRLLRTEFQKIGQFLDESIRCADSLKAYAETDEAGGNATSTRGKVSYALGNIYDRTFGRTVADAHRAESDVTALIRIMMSRAETMCKWIDKNAIRFNEIELYYAPSPTKRKTKSSPVNPQ